MTTKTLLQEVNPEIRNMLRQVELLKHLSEQTPSDAVVKRALPYLNGIASNLAVILRNVNGGNPDHDKFNLLRRVLRRAETTEADIQPHGDDGIWIEGAFNLDEFFNWAVVGSAPEDIAEEP